MANMRSTGFGGFFRRATVGAVLTAAMAIGLIGAVHAESPASRPSSAPATTEPSATRPAGVVDIRQTLAYLASDELQGRGSGTPGIEKAAARIESIFKQLKLQPPAGWDGYFQPFTLTTSTTVDPATVLTAGDGKNWLEGISGKIELGKDYQPLSFSTEGKFDAPVVFAGYGISLKEHGYDDYAGLDVKGKIVLALRFEPVDKEGKSAFTGKKDDWSENAAIPAKAKIAAEHGAIALILVNPPNFNNDDAITPFAKQFQFQRASIPVIQVKQPVAGAMLASAAVSNLGDLQSSIDRPMLPHSIALDGVKIKGDVVFKRTEKAVKNVAAVLPGKGPHADEFIVIGAHYDHLGRGGPGSLAPFSKEIHHGADDNASGTTAMLKLAEELSKAGPHDRSIVFVAFTAEELGLLGSDHFVSHSPVPLANIAAMLNLDMVGRVRDGALQVGGSGTAADFDKILKDANEEGNLRLNLKSKGGMGPSDHTSFAKNHIPVLFFFSGLHLDYHRPTDTADKINYEGIEQVVALAQKVADAVTKMPREAYVATYDSQGMSIMGSGSDDGAGPRVSLGVIPDYDEGSTVKGVRITGTTPGSAAEWSGLKAGDVITDFGDRKLDNLMDLSTALAKSKPGQKVHLKVKRGETDIELDAILTERKG